MMNGLIISALSMLVAGCQSSGYTTGRNLTYPCDESPIVSGDERMRETTSVRCQQLSTSRTDVSVTSHFRRFSFKKGMAAAIYSRALHGTYLTPVEPVNAVKYFKLFEDPDAITRWEPARRFGTDLEPLTVRLFERSDSKRPCGVAVHQWEPYSTANGFRNLMITYVCAPELTEDDMAAMARSLSVDRSKLRL